MATLELARQVLEEYQYFVSQISDTSLLFEDETVLGAVYVFPTALDLFALWSGVEERFLQLNSPKLSRSGKKAWNVYSIFLTPGELGDEDQPKATRIEENFEGTRKVVQAAVRLIPDVKQALYPLIPIQHYANLQEYNPLEAVKNHLGSGFPQSVLDTVLGNDSPLNAFRITISELGKRK